MTEKSTIRFDDGAAYERYMGVWSRLAGEAFLQWLNPATGADWLDVGCGNGAFSELLATRTAAAHMTGIDPSAAQIAFARQRALPCPSQFDEGDAQCLPYADAHFAQAVMALVIFFLPEPARGVAEMRRVVRAGGWVSAYAWDLPGGGFPYASVQAALRALGRTPLLPPSAEASALPHLQRLWQDAGLHEVSTQVIECTREFASFDEFWSIAVQGPSMVPVLAGLSPAELATLREDLAQRLGDNGGPLRCTARAHAVRGRVPY